MNESIKKISQKKVINLKNNKIIKIGDIKNFYSKKCILDFNKLTKLSLEKIKKNDSCHEEIRKVEINIKKYFDSNINKKHLGRLFGNF